MTYVEFPFDRIIELHVREPTSPPPPPPPPPEVTGPCGSGTILVFGFPYSLYFTERRTSYSGFGGTFLMPRVCCPPLPWYYEVDPDTGEESWPPDPQHSYWVPGNGATSVTITFSGPIYPTPPSGEFPANHFAVWIWTGTGSRSPGDRPPDATAGWPGSISVTVPALASAPAPEGLMGTTLLFTVIAGSSRAAPLMPAGRSGEPGTGDVPYYKFDIEHHGCPEGAPPTSPGHPLTLSGRGGFPPVTILSPRCSEF